MITKTVTKLWQGKFVSIRDYELKAAQDGGGMIIKYGSQFMHFTPEQLQAIKPKGKFLQSKFSGKSQLADITWEPATHDPRQRTLEI